MGHRGCRRGGEQIPVLADFETVRFVGGPRQLRSAFAYWHASMLRKLPGRRRPLAAVRAACKLCLMSRWISAALAFAILQAPAHACSYAPASNSPSEIKRAAKQSFDRADAIVDLEVVDPIDWKRKDAGRFRFARYRVLRSWKGSLAAGRLIRVPFLRPCDITFPKADKRRILLEVSGGFLSMDGALNGARYDQSKFDREIDNLIGNDRTASLPTFP